MKRLSIAAILIALTAAPLAYVAAHCEIPCGIYDDDRRFTDMLEDTETISKAIDSVDDLVGSLDGGADPLTINQITRWTVTKEDHATHLQHTIAQYFMTQRIKPSDPQYVSKLTAAHKVMVAAMKCKQNSDPGTADDLKAAIKAFQTAYSKK